jgi:hypothetical protein
MNIALLLLLGCGSDTKEAEEEAAAQEKIKYQVECIDVCEQYVKNPAKAPEWISFHYKELGMLEQKVCLDEAILKGVPPSQLDCIRRSIIACAKSCRGSLGPNWRKPAINDSLTKDPPEKK